MARRRDENPTVYSTEVGRVCPACGRPVGECVCQKGKPRPQGDGVARVRLEKQGRAGKTVTTVSGLPLSDEDLRKEAGDLKRRCGAGGAVKDGVIEIQGDHAEQVLAQLKSLGYKAKRAGG